ncbi:9966_t:CDS:2 [Acaulospora colombiana]|uniref:9966_t:CDS:1 n=1 Tax=Acaulospora colombiana TaxID=27376 RepID=A0ACA9LNL4_9GLOM|nr:9966_t:CDS:2 [Acaulospora colombiana]
MHAYLFHNDEELEPVETGLSEMELEDVKTGEVRNQRRFGWAFYVFQTNDEASLRMTASQDPKYRFTKTLCGVSVEMMCTSLYQFRSGEKTGLEMGANEKWQGEVATLAR